MSDGRQIPSICVPILDLDLTGAANILFLVCDGSMPDPPPPNNIPCPMKLVYPDYIPQPQHPTEEAQDQANRQHQQRETEGLQQD